MFDESGGAVSVRERKAPDRLERARGILKAVENRVGVQGRERHDIERSQALANARAVRPLRLAPRPSAPRQAAPPSSSPESPFTSLPRLVDALPQAARLPGTVSVVGATSALFAVAAAGWGTGAWGAFAALPDAGLLAAAELGVPLERLVVVPQLGPDPVRLLGLLIDGFDHVVLGSLALSGGQQRRLTARARSKGARLLVAGEWEGADVELSVSAIRWSGPEAGAGTLAQPLVSATWRLRRDEVAVGWAG